MHLQGLLGIELPIVQAPMAGVQGSSLAAAVSNAGGLGSLPCAMLNADAMQNEIAQIKALTQRPYNVNFFCHTPATFDAQKEAIWRQTLAPYFDELSIDTGTISPGSGRRPFDADMADALEAIKPPVISFHFGLPSPELMHRLKSWGCKILSTATTLEEALWLEARGVDAIIAQGLEAGGHRGMFLSEDIRTQLGTMALLAQTLKAVRIPVIAAGGISDAQGVAAAIALGAAGVQIGTAYLLCPEATTSTVHRAALKSEAAQVTALTNLFTGRPARGIVNRLMRDIGPMSPTAPAFPLANGAIAPLRAKAESQLLNDFSPLWCGENASGCKEVSAARLTLELASAL
jgi:nitronate monooxygenase